jgi:hypothetical protein
MLRAMLSLSLTKLEFSNAPTRARLKSSAGDPRGRRNGAARSLHQMEIAHSGEEHWVYRK